MRRSIVLLLAGAAILAGSPLAVRAQDTTRTRDTKAKARSQMRIPVRKQTAEGGEVAPTVRVDTVQLPGRVDTVTRTIFRTDTLTVTRVDTMMEPIRLREIGPLYLGLGGGASLPAPSFSDGSIPGWRVDGLLGLDPQGTPFGLRLGLGYSRYTPHDWVSNSIGNAQMMHADGDVKLRIVGVRPMETLVKVYGVAGVSYARFQHVLENGNGLWYIGNNSGTGVPADDGTWHNGWGWNAGGGMEIGKGPANFFIEARFARIKGVASYISNVPLIAGVIFH